MIYEEKEVEELPNQQEAINIFLESMRRADQEILQAAWRNDDNYRTENCQCPAYIENRTRPTPKGNERT